MALEQLELASPAAGPPALGLAPEEDKPLVSGETRRCRAGEAGEQGGAAGGLHVAPGQLDECAEKLREWRVWRALEMAWHARWSVEMAMVVLSAVYSVAMAQLLVAIVGAHYSVREHLPVDLSKVSLQAVASSHRDASLIKSWWSWSSRLRSDPTCDRCP